MWSSNDFKRVKNASKRAITDLNVPNGSRDILSQNQDSILGKMDIAICRFSASFSLKCDVTDAMLQDSKKLNCNV